MNNPNENLSVSNLNNSSQIENYSFESVKAYTNFNLLGVLSKTVFIFIFIFFLILIFTPWQQTSNGSGVVTALDPNDRVQSITANVTGRIVKWYVLDGEKVKASAPIVEIVDNDPNYISRLQLERDAALAKYQAIKTSAETALINYKRQKDLWSRGLVSKMTYEKAKIDHQKLLADEASAAASLAKSEVKFSRQQMQLVVAPKDGTILKVLPGSGGVLVKEGDEIATFVPDTSRRAVEIWIDGNDLPLIKPGRIVSLQFEGWPAVQISGWPSLAIGTFRGIVRSIDPSVSLTGKFRIIVIEENINDWPPSIFLRQGARVIGWVLLDKVTLGYELWRKFNGFPPANNSDYYMQLKKRTGKENKKDSEETSEDSKENENADK